MLLPPPIVLSLDFHGEISWTSYVEPAATWPDKTTIVLGAEPPPAFSWAEYALAADLAARSWSLPTCTAARIDVEPRISTSVAIGNGVNEVIVHRDIWPKELTRLALAQTVILTDGGKILEADIHVNAVDWTFSASGIPEKGFDLQSVLTHELGHLLGIGHSSLPRATMSAGLPPGLGARSLESDDIDAVCTLYPGVSRGSCAEGRTCPAGTACRGRSCERPSERSTLGGPCVGSERACEAAGDDAVCFRGRCFLDCSKTTTICGDYRCFLPAGFEGLPLLCGPDLPLEPPREDPPGPDGGCAMAERPRFFGWGPVALLLSLVLVRAFRRPPALGASAPVLRGFFPPRGARSALALGRRSEDSALSESFRSRPAGPRAERPLEGGAAPGAAGRDSP